MMARRWLVPLAAAAVFATACSEQTKRSTLTAPATPSLIVNGTPTGSTYSSVGALMVDFNKDGVLNGDDEDCTGSLIAPDVFLTAAHCVVDPVFSHQGRSSTSRSRRISTRNRSR